MITVLVISSCTIPMNYGPVRPSKDVDLLKAGYTWEQIQEAKENGTIEELATEARESGAVQRGEQRIAKAQAEEKQRIVKAEQAQYNNYINQKKATCKSYGYTESNGMAQCVEREINAERARLNAQAEQQNRINQENFQRQQQGLRDLADTFSEIGKGTYGQPKTSICNFKSFEGGIISGDCKQLTIKVGNTTYWKMD